MSISATTQIAAILMAIFGASSSFAAEGSFTKTKNPGYIFDEGFPSYSRFNTLSSDFISGTLNKTKKITSIQYSYSNYTNKAIAQEITICMSKKYSTVDEIFQNITDIKSGNSSVFSGKIIAAGNDFYIKHKLKGGTYPTVTPTTPDSITVNYQY